ncbi:hypothetical protein ACP4OV_000041 [Aristida adscensionis]
MGGEKAKAAAGGTVVFIISSDGVRFEVPEAAARQFTALASRMNKDRDGDICIKLEGVSTFTCSKVAAYVRKHDKGLAVSAADLKIWDRDLLRGLTHDELLEVVMAATDLALDSLVVAASEEVAEMVEGKTGEELRKAFDFM